MKRGLLLVLGLMFVASGAFAGWFPPEVPFDIAVAMLRDGVYTNESYRFLDAARIGEVWGYDQSKSRTYQEHIPQGVLQLRDALFAASVRDDYRCGDAAIRFIELWQSNRKQHAQWISLGHVKTNAYDSLMDAAWAVVEPDFPRIIKGFLLRGNAAPAMFKDALERGLLTKGEYERGVERYYLRSLSKRQDPTAVQAISSFEFMVASGNTKQGDMFTRHVLSNWSAVTNDGVVLGRLKFILPTNASWPSLIELRKRLNPPESKTTPSWLGHVLALGGAVMFFVSWFLLRKRSGR